MTETYSFPCYLAAKRSVDDRALNRTVWGALQHALPDIDSHPLRVLEIGAGIGTMFQRLVEWRMISNACYTAVDAEEENIRCAAQALPVWAQAQGLSVRGDPSRLAFTSPSHELALELETADVYDFIRRERASASARQWDLIIAHAFLDLVNVPEIMPLLRGLVRPGGLFYFTINFDGLTIFEPPLDPDLDAKILEVYHQTMDERRVNGALSGDSQTGRKLFAWLAESGLAVLEAGSSDWTVFPRGGKYPADEAYFLHFIIHTVHQALRGNPKLNDRLLDDWAVGRHAQIDSGQLVYIAHQMDFLANVVK